jgi:hypothetical protein
MKAVKVFGAVLLSLVLMVALCVFSAAFLLKMTALNAAYVASLVDDIPLTDIMEEAGKQTEIEDPELFNLLKDVITDNGAGLKQRAIWLVDEVYDYLNSKTDDIDLARALGDSVLNADFAVSIVDNTDLTPLLERSIESLITDEGLPAGSAHTEYIDDMAVDIEPWVKEQAGIVIPHAFDYLLGSSDTFEVTLSLDDLQETLKFYLKQSFLASPPAPYQGLSQAELGQEFDALFQASSAGIPSSYTLDEGLFDSENGTSLAANLAEAERTLGNLREGIGLFNIAFMLLIVLIVLLIAGIILIYRNVKATTLNLGLVALIYGAALMILYFIASRLIRDAAIQQEIASSPAIRDWLIQMSGGMLSPLQILFIAFLAIGVVLLVISCAYHRRQPQSVL